jgi:hypothetical protein
MIPLGPAIVLGLIEVLPALVERRDRAGARMR